MSCDARKWSSGSPTRADTNQFVQSQKKAWNFRFKKKRDCTVPLAKIKVLIGYAVTAQLIWAFGFAFAQILFSHDMAQIHVSFYLL